MADPEVIVIGAGVSGLAFAYHCARAGRPVRVLEQGERPGGCLQTQRAAGGFWFELGAHTCYNSYRALLAILEERGALGELLARQKAPFRLLKDGQIRKIGQELGVLELLACAPRVLFAKKQGKSVREYYEPIVGRGNYQRVFGPLFAAVPSQPADEFPAQMLFKSRRRRKDVPRSFTLRGGLSTAIEAIAGAPGITLETGVLARSLEREAQGFVVRAQAASYRARQVVLAVPPNAAAGLVAGVLPGVVAELLRLKVAAVETVGVVVKKDALSLERVAGIIPLDGRFFSAVSRDTVADDTYRGFSFHFKAGGALDARLELIANVLKVGRASFEQVVERAVVLPSPAVGHAETVARLDRQLPGTGLFLTGNYFDGLSIEDCVNRSAREVERLVAA